MIRWLWYYCRLVEVLDVRANRWRCAPSLINIRSGAGVTVWQDHIVAVGGHRGAEVHLSVEMLIDNTWRELPSMTVIRRNAAVVAVNDYLFAVGGDDGASHLSTIESIQLQAEAFSEPQKIDASVAEWNLLQVQMPQGRSYAGIALLPRDGS
ncbi:unnamed protein product [Caenorhabditis auriculariae]|uniref:Uncharacterized protein n=1 Tax=Caenorhabditis auriculariae TaxID=2777116 RepID=A0A8S1HBJ7_9PELO|nr:unnamed protein product [Caenorhabditis auriculariae]